jgi:hypothetical protein
MTAKAISTPHLHFSHNTWRNCPVHPCGVVVGLLVDAKLVFTTSLACDVVVVAGACTTGRLSHTCGCCVAVVDLEIEGENGLGLIGEVGVVVISGFPLSRSPIFGRSRRVSVQYCGKRGSDQRIRRKLARAETSNPQELGYNTLIRMKRYSCPSGFSCYGE